MGMVLRPDGVCSGFLYRILVNIVLWESTGCYIIYFTVYYMHVYYLFVIETYTFIAVI